METNTNNYQSVSVPAQLAEGLNTFYADGLNKGLLLAQCGLREVSSSNDVEQLLKTEKNGMIFKWTGISGTYFLNGATFQLIENNFYSINQYLEGRIPYLQRVIFSENLENFNVYEDPVTAYTALAKMPADGTIAVYMGESCTLSETFITVDGWDNICEICANQYSIIISSHNESTDEYGNKTYCYMWTTLFNLPTHPGAIIPEGFMEAYVYGSQTFDVTHVKEFTAYSVNSVIGYKTVDSLNDVVEPGIVYTFENKQYMLGQIVDEEGNYQGNSAVPCVVLTDANGGDIITPITKSSGSSTLEVYPTKENVQTIDVSNIDEIIVYPGVNMCDYVNVDTLPEYPAENTVYTLPDGTQWIKGYTGLDEYDTPYGTTCVRCIVECDIYGGDAPAPILPQVVD